MESIVNGALRCTSFDPDPYAWQFGIVCNYIIIWSVGWILFHVAIVQKHLQMCQAWVSACMTSFCIDGPTYVCMHEICVFGWCMHGGHDLYSGQREETFILLMRDSELARSCSSRRGKDSSRCTCSFLVPVSLSMSLLDGEVGTVSC